MHDIYRDSVSVTAVHPPLLTSSRGQQARLMRRIVGAYDSLVIRTYCKIRFMIISINMLHILGLCLRDKHRVLDIGCGFGLFGCYFAALNPNIIYHGIDISHKRIDQARSTAARLGLTNVSFEVGDARQLKLSDQYDAIMMLDLLHHLQDDMKLAMLAECHSHLAKNGRLIIKDVTRHPLHKLAFTWALDVVMTQSLDMWYWNEEKFHEILARRYQRIDTLPITDLLPYPHIIYLCENQKMD